MRRFRIGSAFGIPIKLDLTFLLVLPLFAVVIAIQVETWTDMLNQFWAADIDPQPLVASPVSWALGLTAALGLFAGIVLHELGHSLVAMRYGVAIDSITLWLFGGIAQLEEFPEEWQQELYVAIAGPVVSVALGGISYGTFLLVPPSETLALEATRFLLGYLAVMNVALAVFNMLPGFPMDGGRVLRALLVRTRPYAQATKIAAEVGKGFAILLGLAGVFVVFNPFLIALAFFIYIGASTEAQQTIVRAAFEGVVVADIMTPADRVQTVEEETSVAALTERMLADRHTGYPVERDGEIVGIVTLEDARAVREVEQDAYTVGDVMSTEIHTTAPNADVMEALTEMQENSIGRLVVADEEFAGLLTRSDVMTALSIIKTSGRFDSPASESGETGDWQSRPE
ncbi:site-2 protease family protein [Salinibaculum rarum]|uniref:site-2 protease family protein n=1 Tax=Salinibaculum rarum TaxID=3058903 RepID=UPI0026603D75|nr:site-2 protease family protein [Salinibaculum sp. KK48]